MGHSLLITVILSLMAIAVVILGKMSVSPERDGDTEPGMKLKDVAIKDLGKVTAETIIDTWFHLLPIGLLMFGIMWLLINE